MNAFVDGFGPSFNSQLANRCASSQGEEPRIAQDGVRRSGRNLGKAA